MNLFEFGHDFIISLVLNSDSWKYTPATPSLVLTPGIQFSFCIRMCTNWKNTTS